ncbi:SDH family Clp fold serine proteinase [Sporohalobacter salinus]|uniref:SDH family Clp fold serine proteinase n=1 Tax=Sporohalobacter salinus TaxID=1494606 RepID=UPI00196194A2|nr:ClpP class serine protease [Sporohalobacter salinus]
MDFFSIIWIIFIIITLIPILKQKSIKKERIKLIKKIEDKLDSRLIVLIHRQEAISFLGIPVRRFINIEDSEEILRAIRLTPGDKPIKLVIHTPGGLVLAAEQIAYAIKKHPSEVTVIVPHYAMSGGTLLALAADNIMMDENAVLGPVDPQIGKYPAPSLQKVVDRKDIDEIDDETLILSDVADKALTQIKDLVQNLLIDKMETNKAKRIATILTEGRWTHDYPITVDKLNQMGVSVETELATEIYELMELYPQSGNRRPSVQYINSK